MNYKLAILVVLLSCCLIFSIVSGAASTNRYSVTIKGDGTTPITTDGTTTSSESSAKTMQIATILAVPKVVSITPASGTLGEIVKFTLKGSDFDKLAKVYLTIKVKNEIKTIETRSAASSRTLITGSLKIPTSVPTGDWNVVVRQNGKESNSDVKFTIKKIS